MMKYWWLCFAFILFGCVNQNTTKPNLFTYVSQITENSSPQYDEGYIDLNDDSRKDAIVLLKGMESCGSGGCTLLVFENTGDSYRLVSRTTITRAPIRAAKTMSNGWRDLIVSTRGEGDALLMFNGEKYPLNPSLQPIASAEQILHNQLVLDANF